MNNCLCILRDYVTLNNIDFIFIYRDVLNMFLELNRQIMSRPQYIAAMILPSHLNVISALRVM